MVSVPEELLTRHSMSAVLSSLVKVSSRVAEFSSWSNIPFFFQEIVGGGLLSSKVQVRVSLSPTLPVVAPEIAVCGVAGERKGFFYERVLS